MRRLRTPIRAPGSFASRVGENSHAQPPHTGKAGNCLDLGFFRCPLQAQTRAEFVFLNSSRVWKNGQNHL